MNPAATLADFLARIESRSARIGIVGLGYVGLPLALLFAEERFRVTGLDIDPAKVAKLNAGQSYIHRILPDHIHAAQQAGFHAIADFAQVAHLDAILICVPTPLHPDHTPDMTYVQSTIASIAPHLHPGQLVILESTTWPGTTAELIVPTIERHDNAVLRTPAETPNPTLNGVLVAFSPEREDPGNTTTPRREIPKVVGGFDPAATTAACALYNAIFTATVPLSSPAAAEMTKLVENIYRSVNIALVNELKQLCLRMGIDVWEVLEAASTKPFGFHPFAPGPGVGGHCIPVDPFYLTWKAQQYDFTTRFIELAGKVNESMPAFVVDQTRQALAARNLDLASAMVLILGVAYKRDVDDLRESPALTVINLLRSAGAQVSYNDPYFPEVGSGRHYDLKMKCTPLEQIPNFDCVLILTNHSDYDYPTIAAQSKLLIDTRNATQGLHSPNIIRC
ncbi:MAG: nucleotide sugar dehydrogenase [Acidobacteriota bacterium]